MPDAAGPAPDVVVVGAGIVGCATAAFLAAAGLRVTIVEQAGLASGASGANSGVVQHPFDAALAGLYAVTIDLYRELSALDAGFRLPAAPAGLLFVTRDAGAAQRLAANARTQLPGADVSVMAGRELLELEPALHPDLVACRVGMGYPVAPAASTYAYATLAERHGATVRLGREARLAWAGDVPGGRVVGVWVDGRLIPAGLVIAAAGPWTPALVDPSGRWRPIHRRWGVVVEAALSNPPRHVLEEAEIDAALAGGAEDGGEGGTGNGDPDTRGSAGRRAPVAREFSLSTAAGISAVGSTFLPAEPDPAEWVVPLLERAAMFVPQVADAPLRGVRACARPVSLDGHPLIGALAGAEGLLVCAGHGPWGISTGPASARLIADVALGRHPSIPSALAAGRFGSPFADPEGSPA